MHRLMLLSATYRQQSRVVNAQAEQSDAENRLYWRANRRRLEGEAIRDAVLAASGALNPQLGGPSFRDVQVQRERLQQERRLHAANWGVQPEHLPAVDLPPLGGTPAATR